MNTEFLF